MESVAAQTYPHLEHVVVDGGSTDGTAELLARTDGIRSLSEPDEGQSAAINKGFRLAGGDVLTWLNADDVLVPRATELAVGALGRHPAADWAYGDCRVVERGRTVTVWRAPRRLTLSRLERGEHVPQPGSFVTRSALERVGGVDESFALAMDVDLWLRLLSSGAVPVHVPAVLSVFELHPESKTGSVARADFCREVARAFVRAGRPRGAAFALGQAAAAATAAGGNVTRERLERELAETAARAEADGLPADLLHAAALTEAAVLEAKAHPRRAGRLLLARDPWRFPETRARLLAAARRGVAQRRRNTTAVDGEES